MTFARATQFLKVLTILKCPTRHTDAMKALEAMAGGERVRFVNSHKFHLLAKVPRVPHGGGTQQTR